MGLGGAQKFFDTFERAAPGAAAARDMSSAANSDTSPKTGTLLNNGTNNYEPDGSGRPVQDAYADWNTLYS
jgi:hypothetical protein